MHLGGGVFGDGFVQEEIMCMETPELANAAANNLRTRSSGDKVFQGSPEPLLFKGAHRVMEIEGVYGDDWLHTSVSQLDKDSPLLLKSDVEQIIILAMAAPRVESKGQETSLETIKDLFNTFYAGFLLAADNPGGALSAHRSAEARTARSGRRGGTSSTVRVNTGPIGAGDFGNSKLVVYVVQRLAAKEANVNLRFCAYDDAMAKEADEGYYDKILTHQCDVRSPPKARIGRERGR